tara:strand:- start:279 stop:491 length:213 start_codon:yes stop_codon:yes gene_type:complete
MKMQKVESSMVKAVGYDSEEGSLHVKFNNDSIYKYLEVPEALFHSLLGAESKGKYINKNVKNLFKFEKVE